MVYLCLNFIAHISELPGFSTSFLELLEKPRTTGRSLSKARINRKEKPRISCSTIHQCMGRKTLEARLRPSPTTHMAISHVFWVKIPLEPVDVVFQSLFKKLWEEYSVAQWGPIAS